MSSALIVPYPLSSPPLLKISKTFRRSASCSAVSLNWDFRTGFFVLEAAWSVDILGISTLKGHGHDFNQKILLHSKDYKASVRHF